MTNKDLVASATVTLCVEVSGVGTWGPACTVDQIHDQAVAAAIGKLSRHISESTAFRIVGTPAVRTVVLDRKVA